MRAFETEAGSGSYEAGLLTLPDGRTRGIESVALERPPAAGTGPDFLGALRGVLPDRAGLPMPLRLAVSTMRAGLGAIGDELGGERDGLIPVDLVLGADERLRVRMPARLAETMERDRVLVRAALARATPTGPASGTADPSASPAADDAPLPDGPAEALTSIFRYEKRNGRLRRVSEPGIADDESV